MSTDLETLLLNYGKISEQEQIVDELAPLENMDERFREMMMIYMAAIREVRTKIEVLNDEFKIRSKRNPIRYIKQRIKRPASIMEKMHRRGFELSLDSMIQNVNDIAGIRVVCGYGSDIYDIADMLKKQDDVRVVLEKDYIKNPKPNGYRSMHIVVEIPVFFSDRKQYVKVEIQIRTMAMDFWASLEHQLQYKYTGNDHAEIIDELRECAEKIHQTDTKMQAIHDKIMQMEA